MLCNLRRSFRLFFVLMPSVYYVVCVNSEWGQWSLWSSCTVTCGYNRFKNRFRSCINSSPPNGGLPCPGDTDGDNVEWQSVTCPNYSCPAVDGEWGQWLQWSVCTKTCGGNGYRYKKRYCNNPSPANGGKVCEGVNPGTSYQYSYDYTCADQGCPVDGGWGQWLQWSDCTKTCGGNGYRYKQRYCTNPSPANGGKVCEGVNPGTNYQYSYDNTCAGQGCPVNGKWSEWYATGVCSTTCGGGTMTYTRQCNNPKPSHGGLNCTGNNTDYRRCGETKCPVDGHWTVWSTWSSCTVTCDGGNRTKERNCTDPPPKYGGKICNGSEFEYDDCSIQHCPATLSSEGGSKEVAIGGAIGAVVVLLIIVAIVVMLLRKRKRSSLERKAVSSAKHSMDLAGKNVVFRPEPTNQDKVYFNIGRASGLSCTDTDDEIQQSSKDVAKECDPDNVYCNVDLVESSFLTKVKVDEFGEYIKKREINEGLNDEYKSLPHGAQYPTTLATAKENIPKNRFKMIYPYDHSRVILYDGPDFINANYIDGFEKEKSYIACQGPIKTTLVDHWKMIWQLHISTIVMLTNLVEGAKRKCERYWPEQETVTTYGNLVLTLLSVKIRATYVTREISVEDKTNKEKRTIIQYHFTSWPDHGTPDPLYLVWFHRHVITEQSTSNAGPLLVHCSAGIGRTGTYIGLDALYEQGKKTGFIDVAEFVKKMRYCRINMVQTPEQYVCLHHALNEAFTMKDRNIDKNEFGMVWRKIVSDKRPINHQILREEFKILGEHKLEHAKSEYVFATSTENKDKNRHKSVLPSDADRLYLSSFEKGRTDYINAVQLPSYTKLNGYLITQLPLPDTKVDFWTMIRDHDSSVIVMFLKEHSEADFVYSTSKSTGSLGSNTLKILNTVEVEHGIKVISLTLNKKETKQRDIMIYQFACDGLPEAEVLCKLMNLMSTEISMAEGPVTVVSCDGARICGLFSTFTNAVSSMTIDENADIFQLARLAQLRRPEFFKDFEEYRKVYEAVNYHLESTNVYANF